MVSMQDLLNPELLARLAQPSPQTQSQPYGQYGVPVVETLPDVVLRGRLDLEITFKHADVIGKSFDEVQRLVYAVVNGNSGPGFPMVRTGNLQIWEERPSAPAQIEKTAPGSYGVVQTGVIDESLRQRIIAEFLRDLGQPTPDHDRVLPTRHPDDSGSPGDSVYRVPELRQQRESELPDATGIRDSHIHAEQPASDGPGTGATKPPGARPRTHKPKRQATDQPQEPAQESSLAPDVMEYNVVDD